MPLIHMGGSYFYLLSCDVSYFEPARVRKAVAGTVKVWTVTLSIRLLLVMYWRVAPVGTCVRLQSAWWYGLQPKSTDNRIYMECTANTCAKNWHQLSRILNETRYSRFYLISKLLSLPGCIVYNIVANQGNRRAGKWHSIDPWPFIRRTTGAEVPFHYSIIGHFMVYKDRFETNLVQLFANTENSERFSIYNFCYYFLIRSTLLLNRNKHN